MCNGFDHIISMSIFGALIIIIKLTEETKFPDNI